MPEETLHPSEQRLSHIGRISRHFVIYGLGGMAEKLVAFLFIPLYTNYLSPEEYGVLVRALLIMALLGLLISGGMHSALLKFYAGAKDDRDKAAAYSTIMAFVWAVVPFVAAVVFMCAPLLSEVLLGARADVRLIYVGLLYLPFGMTNDLGFTFFRAMQRSVSFVVFSLIRFSLSLVFNIVFIVLLRYGAEGVLWSGVVVNVPMAVVLQFVLLRGAGFHPDIARLSPILRYGLPLVPFTIFEVLIGDADKFFVGRFCSQADVGVYSLAYKLGMAIFYFFIMPFERIWTAYLFDLDKKPEGAQVYARALTYLMLMLTAAGLGVSLFSREMVEVMSARSYWEAAPLVPVIVLAHLFYASTRVFNGGLLVTGATATLSWLTALGLAVNTGANLVLIPAFGPMGAALATLATYAVMAGASFWASHRVLPVSYEWTRTVAPVVLAGFLVVPSYLWVPGSRLVAFGFHSLLFLAFPMGLLLFPFFTRGEKAIGLQQVARLAGFVTHLKRRST